MRLSEILTPNHIKIPLQAKTKIDAIEELLQIMTFRSSVQTLDIVPIILKREALGSTGIGKGIAIPHCRFEGIEKPLLALGIPSGLIDWESVDNEPVDIIWLSISPEEPRSTNLIILTQINKLINCADFVAFLRKVQLSQEVINKIIEFGL